MLDGIEDPHNVGAILRTADAAGAHGVVRQARHAASLDGIVGEGVGRRGGARADRDRREHRARDRGAEGAGSGRSAWPATPTESLRRVDLTLPTALVLGAEGTGLRRLVRERCDRLVSIPMAGAVDSLNVSVAAGVVLFEAVRQRREVSGQRNATTGPNGCVGATIG